VFNLANLSKEGLPIASKIIFDHKDQLRIGMVGIAYIVFRFAHLLSLFNKEDFYLLSLQCSASIISVAEILMVCAIFSHPIASRRVGNGCPFVLTTVVG
jgi:hypothetical protein